MQSRPPPCSAWAETLRAERPHSHVVSRAAPSAGVISLKSNPSAPKPFPTHEANSLTGHQRVLGREVKGFLLHPTPVPASLFFVSILPPKERSTLPGFVLVCVYGWSPSLIVKDLFFTQSPPGSGKASDKPCTCTPETRTPRAELLKPSHSLSPRLVREGQLWERAVLPAAKGLVWGGGGGSLQCAWNGLCWAVQGTALSLTSVGRGELECLFSLAPTQEGRERAWSKNSFIYSR